MSIKKKINDQIYFTITNETDFENYLLNPDSGCYNTNFNYILETNINWTKIQSSFRTTIKDFTGIFDGNRYGIYNYGGYTDNIACGLFQSTEKAVVKNLILNIEETISGFSYMGGLIGIANKTVISDCYITGTINLASEGQYIGILSGYLFDCTVTNVTINVKDSYLQGNRYVGGFTGIAEDCIIKNSIVCGELIILGVNYEYLDEEYDETIVVYPQEIGGFIGSSLRNFVEKCQVSFVGSVTGINYISGFVPIDFNSKFIKCCMEINGSINAFFDTVSLFCSLTKNINYLASVFFDCKIGNRTRINSTLIDIDNIDNYSSIAKLSYKVTFKDSIYPKSYYEILKLKNELLDKDNIIYKLFDYILTYKQLQNIRIEDLELFTETEVINMLLNIFNDKWANLTTKLRLLFLEIGFDSNSFDIIKMPDIKWEDFSKNQRISALQLGFNKKIWNEKILEQISRPDTTFSYAQTNMRQIMSFRIEIPKMVLKFPNYIKNLVLIEIKDFLVKRLFGSYLRNSENIKVFLSDKDLLNILVIIDNNDYIIDDKDDIECIPELLSENIEEINEINIKEEEDKIKTLTPVPETPEPPEDPPKICYTVKLPEDVNFGDPVNYFNINASIIANITINGNPTDENDILLIYVNSELRGKSTIYKNEDICWVNTKIYTSNYFEVIQFKVYKPDVHQLYNVPDLQLILKPGQNFGSSTEPIIIDADGCTPPDVINVGPEDNFGNPTIYYEKVVNIYSIVTINYQYAKAGDVLGIYVGDQLRGKIEIKIVNNIPIADGIIYSSGDVEVINFLIFSKENESVFKVPDFTLKIKPNCIIGSDTDPIYIKGLGNTPVDLHRVLFLHQPRVDKVICEIGCNTVSSGYDPIFDIDCNNTSIGTNTDNDQCQTSNCNTSNCNTSNCNTSNCNTSGCQTSCCNTSCCQTSCCQTSCCQTSCCQTSCCQTSCNNNNNNSEQCNKKINYDNQENDNAEVSEDSVCEIDPCQNSVLNYYSALKLLGRTKENRFKKCIGGSASGMGVNNVSGF